MRVIVARTRSDGRLHTCSETTASNPTRRSSRIQARAVPTTSTLATSRTPTALAPGPAASKINEKHTYDGIITTVLDVADSYLGLGPITHELEVSPKLRTWIEEMSKKTSPSELFNVLNDMKSYLNVVTAGLGTVVDPESENKLWEMEMKKAEW